MATAAPENPIGLIENLPNETYHSGPAVSKSQLDWIHQSPALLEWSRKAPVDDEAEKAVDLGNAFEAALLEPERFNQEYIEAPEVDKRTNAGKATWREFLDQAGTKHVLTYEEARRIRLMTESTWAHPMARRVLETDHLIQSSYYWQDPVTDELCRCRPDVLCTQKPISVDVKASADMRTFRQSMAAFRYAVQDSFYSDGLSEYFGGETPHFIFIAAFTSRSAGRYPVHVFEFDIESKHAGTIEYRADLEHYAKCKAEGKFDHLEPLRLPSWALASAESL